MKKFIFLVVVAAALAGCPKKNVAETKIEDAAQVAEDASSEDAVVMDAVVIDLGSRPD